MPKGHLASCFRSRCVQVLYQRIAPGFQRHLSTRKHAINFSKQVTCMGGPTMCRNNTLKFEPADGITYLASLGESRWTSRFKFRLMTKGDFRIFGPNPSSHVCWEVQSVRLTEQSGIL